MKEKSSKGKSKAPRHAPLGQQILDADAPRNRKRAPKQQAAADPEYVGSRLSEKILRQAHEQQRDEAKSGAGAAAARGSAAGETLDFTDDEDDDVVKSGSAEDGQNYLEQLQIHAEDEETLQRFMQAPGAEAQPQQLRLADLIMEKITEKQTELASQMSEMAKPEASLDPKIVKVFTSVGKILSSYRAGKLPKAFKIIPSLKNWEEVLYVTEPDLWTAASMFQATRIFSSNLNAKMAQRFYNLVLFPRIRDDIAEFKKLNFHLYMALKKSLFKPAAFFKGLLIPLCEAGNCTLREAVIISSIMTRTSIPVLHASAAMLKLAEMPYSGAVSIFLRVLLDKKYALPYRVVDALCFHFYRFQNDTRQLPVLWHQSLLIFCIRYKEDITSEQKEALLELLRKHNHVSITEDVRREIVYSRSRDREAPLENDPAYTSGGAANTNTMMS